MAAKFVTKSDPFYAALGARLGLDDLVASVALVAAGTAVWTVWPWWIAQPPDRARNRTAAS